MKNVNKSCLRSTEFFKYNHPINDHDTYVDTNTDPGLLLLLLLLLYEETIKLTISVYGEHHMTVSSTLVVYCYILINVGNMEV